MKRVILCAAIFSAALSVSPAAIFAQSTTLPFPSYMWSKKPAQSPFGSDCRVPFVFQKETFYIPCGDVLLPNSSHSLSNKTIDCATNNCVNFPGGINWNDPVPTSCAGRPDGSLYFNGSVVTICSSGGYLALNGGGCLGINGGGCLGTNP